MFLDSYFISYFFGGASTAEKTSTASGRRTKVQNQQEELEGRLIRFPLVAQLCAGSVLFRRVDKQKLADSARSANDSFVKDPLFHRSYRDVLAVAYHTLCT